MTIYTRISVARSTISLSHPTQHTVLIVLHHAHQSILCLVQIFFYKYYQSKVCSRLYNVYVLLWIKRLIVCIRLNIVFLFRISCIQIQDQTISRAGSWLGKNYRAWKRVKKSNEHKQTWRIYINEATYCEICIKKMYVLLKPNFCRLSTCIISGNK